MSSIFLLYWFCLTFMLLFGSLYGMQQTQTLREYLFIYWLSSCIFWLVICREKKKSYIKFISSEDLIRTPLLIAAWFLSELQSLFAILQILMLSAKEYSVFREKDKKTRAHRSSIKWYRIDFKPKHYQMHFQDFKKRWIKQEVFTGESVEGIRFSNFCIWNLSRNNHQLLQVPTGYKLSLPGQDSFYPFGRIIMKK